MATITGLQLKSTIYGFMLEQYSGVATAGTANSIVDGTQAIGGLAGFASETWPTKIVGQQIRITSGAAAGNLRIVGKFEQATGTMYPHQQWFLGNIPVANDTYELWGTSINGGTPLTNLINDVLRALRPFTDTQITIVTSQRQYDISSIVQSRRDIAQVYLRLLDPSGTEPYHIYDLSPGLEWWAYDRGGAGTTSVTLELQSALTTATTAQQLWIRAETTFTPLTDDTSTLDAVYRDWLAWEVIMELARRRLSMGTADRTRWQGLRDRAVEELRSWRPRWTTDPEPLRIATWP